MTAILGYDAIHINIGKLPPKTQNAGYTTGSSDIRWREADWDSHPTAVRIDQDFNASDPSADVLDVENGAATFADCPFWAKKAREDYDNVARAGQRNPTIYTSESNVTNVANALVNGGVKSGVGLWVADWGIGVAKAFDMIDHAGGPFPIVGVQYDNGTFYDYDAFNVSWLTNVSGAHIINPVSELKVTRRGFTSIELAWNEPKGATGYTVKTYWRDKLQQSEDVTTPYIRVGHLSSIPRTYTFKVRAHPSGSQGSDATIKATTR